MTDDRYPAIADYGLLSDCHCSALVSKQGSVDWCCMPCFDDDSSFGRLLDWDKGGHCSIAPAGPYTSERQYVAGTMILETYFRTEHGTVRLTDFLAMDTPENPHYDLVRIVEGLAGEVEMRVQVCPRFDYGEIVPRMVRHGDSLYTAIGSNQGLLIRSDMPLDVAGHADLCSSVRLRAGQRARLAVQFAFPERIDCVISEDGIRADELDRSLERNRQCWSIELA
ncbi:MAG TPA: trehalase-like domain-containing protein [Noviherbaspirillum sp.]|uniref:trehalase-like domain-containing protein n=1 Tax=Noviherbaspirillum sp. TaxID=1926288 RepID=UPI002D55B46D|nr:trehalase-like domain-containing protein [Noviherbaspirillum sp.]HYD96568.1 trehalase-like domain-containing protein [Noviherbaspirillum sp.]